MVIISTFYLTIYLFSQTAIFLLFSCWFFIKINCLVKILIHFFCFFHIFFFIDFFKNPHFYKWSYSFFHLVLGCKIAFSAQMNCQWREHCSSYSLRCWPDRYINPSVHSQKCQLSSACSKFLPPKNLQGYSSITNTYLIKKMWLSYFLFFKK